MENTEVNVDREHSPSNDKGNIMDKNTRYGSPAEVIIISTVKPLLGLRTGSHPLYLLAP